MNSKVNRKQDSNKASNMAEIVNRNIKALAARRQEDENNKPVEERNC